MPRCTHIFQILAVFTYMSRTKYVVKKQEYDAIVANSDADVCIQVRECALEKNIEWVGVFGDSTLREIPSSLLCRFDEFNANGKWNYMDFVGSKVFKKRPLPPGKEFRYLSSPQRICRK